MLDAAQMGDALRHETGFSAMNGSCQVISHVNGDVIFCPCTPFHLHHVRQSNNEARAVKEDIDGLVNHWSM